VKDQNRQATRGGRRRLMPHEQVQGTNTRWKAQRALPGLLGMRGLNSKQDNHQCKR